MKYNEESEKSVLCGLCEYGQDIYVEIQDVIDSKSFFKTEHQIIFSCIKNSLANNSKIDYNTILSSATELGMKDVLSKIDIRFLFNNPSVKENVINESKRVARLAITRKLQETLFTATKKLEAITGNESVTSIIDIAHQPILNFSQTFDGSDDSPKLLGENVDDYLDYLMENPNRNVGIPSGFPRYDAYIGGGFRRKSVSLIGARMKAGKSMLAANIAINVCRNKIPVLLLDTEMNEEDHLNRLLAHFSKININSIEASKFTSNPNYIQKVKKAGQSIKQLDLTYKNVSGRSLEEILSIMRKWILKHVGETDGRTNDCLIIYDYLKLMSSSSLGNNLAEYQALGFHITDLHNFTVQYDVPILSFVQLNRDGINNEDTSVISQSDRIAWLCTNFSIFKFKTPEEINDDGEQEGNRKLIPLISRHGPGIEDGNYINMFMEGQYCMITEGKTKFEIAVNGGTNDNDDPETEVTF